MSSVNISTIQSTGNQAQDMQNLFDAYARLRKELIHGLSFLDDENVPMLKTIVGDIEGAFTAITQTEESITLLAADVESNTSAISVQAGQISLKVSSNGVIAAINLSPETISISASKINLVGAVTVLSDITGNLGTITSGRMEIGSGAGKMTILDSGSVGYINFSSGYHISGDNGGLYLGKTGMSAYIDVGSFSNDDSITIQANSISFNTLPYVSSIGNLATESFVITETDDLWSDSYATFALKTEIIEKGSNVKRIGAGSDRLFIVFNDNSVHEVLFD